MPSSSGAAIDAVTIDAFGTLVELESPVGRLQAALAERNVERDEKSVAAAFASEVEYYLVHKGEGKDDESLLDLRRRCAGVFLEGVAPELGAEEFAPAFVDSLVFRPLDGVVDALARMRRAGLELACVTNWDVGIGEQLERAGLAHYLSAVVSSAETGAEKPDPRVFAEALGRLRVSPERAIHIGDDEADQAGALAAGLGFEPPPLATLPERLGL
ncbi:MAG TPA: HAD-IA family hydrolase [Gaiellaceae bacterium]|jgi:putative hydrolase of the HAD superfamily|nr:HAD-IA family hydrolase [Gaiellaceae bacterium]